MYYSDDVKVQTAKLKKENKLHMPAKFFRGSQDTNRYTQHTHSNTGASQLILYNQQNIALTVIYVMCLCAGAGSRVQCVWLTGCKQSTAAEPYLVATMPLQGPEQETLERRGNSQGMLNISWTGRHSAW